MSEHSESYFERTVVGIVSFKVRPGDLAGWRDQWEAIARQAEATPGCRSFKFAENTRESETYVIITEWSPGGAWLAFIQSTPALHALQRETWRSSFTFYELLADRGQLPE